MAKKEKKLFLLDALALIYRAYYAFIKNPRVNSQGLNTSAMFGFTNTLLDVLNKENPSHIAVCFDTMEPTVRHDEEEYEGIDYKGNRESMPEDIVESIPYIKEIIEAFNIPVIESDGYEADDVIGTLAKKAEKKGYEVYMMTPDKDFGQLVSDKVFMYKPARFGNSAEVWGVKEVCDKFKIKRVDQVIDMLGLWGDSVDNIPGVPGVGEKTAQKLLGEYDTVEGVIENADKLKGKLAEKVRDNAKQALMSKELATIIIDAPVEFNAKELEVEKPDEDALKELFKELEFRTMAKRIFGEESAASTNGTAKKAKHEATQQNLFEQKDIVEEDLGTLHDVKHKYTAVTSAAEQKKLANDLAKEEWICFDTETTGLDVNTAELVGLAFSIKKKQGFYVPVPENKKEAQAVVEIFRPLFENKKVGKIGQNIKYDIMMLRWYDVEVKGEIFDTMLAHYLIEPDSRHNMNILAENYLNYSPVKIETLIGKKGKNQKSMRDVPLEDITEYAVEDADITWQLKPPLEKELKADKLTSLFNEVEMPLVNVLADMELEGVKVDEKTLNEFSGELGKDIKGLEKNIYKNAGEEFNIASPKQLGEILFKKLELDPKAKKTKTGQFATGEDILTRLAPKHKIIQHILDFRQLNKLKNTYVDTLPEMINPKTGRVHTSFNQAVAATGRLSSQHPNLQNIPIRTEKGREVRKAFVPRNKDYTLLSADYSQIELRIIAHLSEDKSMISAFKDKLDIHAATAAKVYEVDYDKVTSDMRRNAKMVNFGIIYGISAFGLSQRLDIPRKEAAEIIDSYFTQYPNIKKYMDKNISIAQEQGYVETMLKRRRYLRDINSGNAVVRGFAERNAINAPIQGSAADMIKIAMINIHAEMKKKKLESKMILQVHDELVVDVNKSELDTVQPIITKLMQNAMKLKVPLDVESGTGNNWLEAH
ncbi:MAG: DNA polymerase I [Bacteroidia bacterium]|nr:DNA polymerase I [Bacteroidia bacterium]